MTARVIGIGLLSVALASEACASRSASASRPAVADSSYVGPNGHGMVVIRSREFQMGSPPGERGRSAEETLHRVRIPRAYAVATTEVTNEQFARVARTMPR